MMSAAARRRFDVVLFWALDRFTREGALATLQYLNRLSSYGVGFLFGCCRYGPPLAGLARLLTTPASL